MNFRTIDLIFLIPLVFILGCVSESEHQKVLDENQKLKDEINELKFGIPKLYSDANKLFKLGEYSKSLSNIEKLLAKHPDAVETAKVKKLLPTIQEEILWKKIDESNNLMAISKYLNEYHDGKYYKETFEKKETILNAIRKKGKRKNSVSNTKEIVLSPILPSVSPEYKIIKSTSLKQDPTQKSQVITRLNIGESIELLENKDKWWYKVKYKNQIGWVKASCLEK